MIKVQEQVVTPPDGPYVFAEWDPTTREPSLVLGGFTLKVHIPDLIERLTYLTEALRKLQKGSVDG